MRIGGAHRFFTDSMGDRLGEDVHLLSITGDPKNDDWQAMPEMAELFVVEGG